MEWGTSVSCPRIPGSLRVLLPCLGLTDLQALMNSLENALPGRWLTFGNSSGVVAVLEAYGNVSILQSSFLPRVTGA